jgi:hypothetical protein
MSCSSKKSGTVEKVIFNFGVKDLRDNFEDSDDDGELLMETQGEQFKRRLRAQKEQ